MDEVQGKDRLYVFNQEAIDSIREAKAWLKDPKYFKRVKISPSASIKMMSHCQSGVEKGIRNNGVPVEVMGLLLGHPDHEDPHAFIISDTQALPIEGFETSVVADDQEVINYQISLGEANELTRKDLFCGWYHSHPFDLDGTNHCYLSKTDVTTQTLWQNQEDNHGNPWLAIVVDPQLSLAKSSPEIRAFRVYPAGYTPPKNQTPDGVVVADAKVAIERWGACWDNYYLLEVSYFMSQLAHNTLNTFRDKFMWMNALTTNPMSEPEKRKDLLDLITKANKEAKASTGSGMGVFQQAFAQSSKEEDESGGKPSSVSQVCITITLFCENCYPCSAC